LAARLDLVVYRLPGSAMKDAALETPAEREAENEEPALCWRRCPDTNPREDSLLAAAVGRKPEQEIMRRTWLKDFSKIPARAIGIGMQIRALAATPRFAPESGLHVLKSSKQGQPARVLIEGTESELEAYLPPEGITRRGAIGSQARRRVYDRTLEMVEDPSLECRLLWQDRAVAGVLAKAIDDRLQRNLLSIIAD
jgi:hypothetical protein